MKKYLLILSMALTLGFASMAMEPCAEPDIGALDLSVKDIYGHNRQVCIPIRLMEIGTVDDLKGKLQDLFGVAPERQRLICSMVELSDECSLRSIKQELTNIPHLILIEKTDDDLSRERAERMETIKLNRRIKKIIRLCLFGVRVGVGAFRVLS